MDDNVTDINALLTEKQLIEKTGFSRMSLYRARKKGLPFKRFNRTVLYDYKKVCKWMDEKGNK